MVIIQFVIEDKYLESIEISKSYSFIAAITRAHFFQSFHHDLSDITFYSYSCYFFVAECPVWAIQDGD